MLDGRTPVRRDSSPPIAVQPARRSRRRLYPCRTTSRAGSCTWHAQPRKFLLNSSGKSTAFARGADSLDRPPEEQKATVDELDSFISDFRLTPRWGAQLFGRSSRTWRRWRRRGVPAREQQRVADMVELCREGRGPINHSLARGPWIGCAPSWRARLYGPAWREWRYDFSQAPARRRRRLPTGA